ncbi:MAG: Prephenate dehydratase [Ilumatobacteraceae bacterium]|nr:Prephenate dehydratase [Ilumatobacteraceae bacterium]
MNDLVQPSPPSDADRPERVGFLGPLGTFTEQALLTQPDLVHHQRERYDSMAKVLRATEDGEVDLGFVAIENSIEGTVHVTSDILAFDVDLLIQREVVIPIQQHLMAPPGVTLADIDVVASIPVATAQCHLFLRQTLPDAAPQPYNSTAEAAKAVSESSARNVAAIANELAASIYGLDIIERQIEDHPENETRFVAVAPGVVPAPTGHDKTSLVVFQHEDAPGSLLAILQQFAARSINLTNLQSRPTKKGLGDYCFLIDLEGHVADDVVADCLKVLRTKGHELKFLGSYPAAGDHGPALREAQSDAARQAESWLADIRARITPS